LRIPIAVLSAAALSASLFAAPAARAQYDREPQEEGHHRSAHDGFFLRLQAGVAYLHADADFAGGNSSAYGGAGVLGLAIGGAVAENVVLFAEVWGMSAVNPKLRFAGVTTVLQDSALNYAGAGVGIGTFLMPAHVYFGVSVDVTRLGMSNNDGSRTNSDAGLAVTATLGKQFWLSRHAGLGISVTGIAGGNRDNNSDTNSVTFKTFTGYGALSLTFG
jgi:hypothetical protein